MGCIYMRISPSGKYYIGKTMRPEHIRWAEHMYKASYSPQIDCWLLNQAINKYGGNNFSVKILEDNINDPTILSEREHYWINFYDATNNKKGYNRSFSDGYLPQPVEQFDLNGKKLKEWVCVAEILKFYNWNERNLYDCLSGGYSHFNGYLWKYKNDPRSIEELVTKYQFNHGKLGGGHTIKCLETNEIFPSMRDLERKLNVNHGVINGRFKRSKNNTIEYNNLHYIKENKV